MSTTTIRLPDDVPIGPAEVADVQADQEVGQRPILGGLDGVLQVAYGDVAEALHAQDDVPVDGVDVADVGDETGTRLRVEVGEQLRPLLAEALDVHGRTTGDGLEALHIVL